MAVRADDMDRRDGQRDSPTERAVQDDLARRKAAARRTAWIVGLIAAALFIASLVQGHLSQIPHY